MSASRTVLLAAALLALAAAAPVHAQSCAPIVCPSGSMHPSCTPDGHPINYFADPCRMEAIPSFNDVSLGNPHRDGIAWFAGRGLVKGYGDGTFRPERTVSRAEFLKLLLPLVSEALPACADADPFRDVPVSAWFAPYVCAAKASGLVKGYEDGTFRPADKINLAEASAIIAAAFDYPLTGGNPWYRSAVTAVGDREAIPDDVGSVQQHLRRGQVAEMLWRLKESIRGKAFAPAERVISQACVWLNEEAIPGVDMEEVRRVWLSWTNGTRKEVGLAPYEPDRQLERTAYLWSAYSRSVGSMSHKRPGQSAYYDYPLIQSWFKDKGLEFQNVNRTTFTENIGWGYFSCKKPDCTAEMLSSIRTTYDFFLSEKGKAYSPHYDSIVNAGFRRLGVSVAWDPGSRKYYLTAHYATAITSDPPPVCP